MHIHDQKNQEASKDRAHFTCSPPPELPVDARRGVTAQCGEAGDGDARGAV